MPDARRVASPAVRATRVTARCAATGHVLDDAAARETRMRSAIRRAIVSVHPPSYYSVLDPCSDQRLFDRKNCVSFGFI